ncbi:unnamed protein product [Taenia asiatica]|uniref:Uncharacterized protein n=1 Tax=Taenia asiatica TaxID=60517 RepID=A0A0R3VUF6_TAEAS|nr:unnamed protein product [Taenia asiatica]
MTSSLFEKELRPFTGGGGERMRSKKTSALISFAEAKQKGWKRRLPSTNSQVVCGIRMNLSVKLKRDISTCLPPG